LLASLYAYQSAFPAASRQKDDSSMDARTLDQLPFDYDLSSLPSDPSQILYDPNYPLSCMPYKWLRAVSKGLFTGIHMDKVYFPIHSSVGLLTLWIPLGDISPHQGSLIFIPGSHSSKDFEPIRLSYGNSKVGPDGTRSGWLDPSLLNGLNESSDFWKGGEYRMGDVVLLGLETLHQTTPNQTDYWRLSIESRWMDPSLLSLP
jgi:ectoine hydroxylase-related dioxygenase (phytanoyl-CoA dioxygenase family)